MKFFLTVLACVFLAINADEVCDLARVQELIGELKSSVLAVSGCNDLNCTRSLVDRANISLRADADCAINEINSKVDELEERADRIRESGREVNDDCVKAIEDLKSLGEDVREKVDCIVDDLVRDCQAAINETDCAIKDKENIECWLNDALACENQDCISKIEAALEQAKIDDVASILKMLADIRAEVKEKISCASSEINKVVEDAKCRARELINSASDCLERCEG